jgi:WD40 repeat protein
MPFCTSIGSSQRWNVRLGALVAVLLASGIITAALADSGFTGGADGKVKIWSLPAGTVAATITAHEAAVTAVALSPDRKLLATGGADRKIKLWNAADGAAVRTLAGHDGAVTCLSFSPDGSKLLSGGADKKVKIWKVADGSLVGTMDRHRAALVGVFLTPGALVSASTDGKFEISSEDGATSIASIDTEHSGGLKAIATNPAKQITFTAGGEGDLKYWSPAGKGKFDGGQGAAVTALALSADVKRLASAGADGKVKIWDAETHKLLKTIDSGNAGRINTLALTPDGAVLVTGGADGKVRAFDTATGQIEHEQAAHEGGVTVLILSIE